MRRTFLIAAILPALLALIILGTITALWISMRGTFRGEDPSVETLIQIGAAVMCGVGLAFLIRSLLQAARKV